MATIIQIMCSRPGMRRLGIEHPATATYDDGRWSAEQLLALRDDPAFAVQEIDDAAVVITGAKFDDAVGVEVERRLAILREQMQASFDAPVTSAAAERVAKLTEEFARVAAAKAEREAEVVEMKSTIDSLRTELSVKSAEYEKAFAETEARIAAGARQPKK